MKSDPQKSNKEDFGILNKCPFCGEKHLSTKNRRKIKEYLYRCGCSIVELSDYPYESLKEARLYGIKNNCTEMKNGNF